MDILNSVSRFLDARKLRKVIRDRRTATLRRYAIGSVLVLVAIIITLNLLVGVLTRDLKFDFTPTKMNTLTPETKDVLSKLNDEVEIIGLFEKPTNLQGSIYQPFIPLLDEYRIKSGGKIKVTYIDPLLSPTFVDGIDPTGATQFTEGNFVIRSGNRFLEINPYSCIIFDPYEYAQNNRYVAIGNRIETVFTGTISYLTAENLQQIYFLKGHQESENFLIASLLQFDGYESRDLYLDNVETVPDDCDLIVLNLPQNDISVKEAGLLAEYLSSGGRIIVACDFSSFSVSLERLSTLVESMGISLSTDLIYEYSPDHLYDVKDNSFSKGIVSSEYAEAFKMNYVSVGQARNVEILNQSDAGISVRPILTSSVYATINPNGVIDDQKISQGVYNYAVIAKRTTDNSSTGIAVLGTGFLSADEYLNRLSSADENTQFFRNLVRSMTDQGIASPIPPKDIPGYRFENLPSVSMQTLWSVILIALFPFIFISAGLIVYYRRKHR